MLKKRNIITIIAICIMMTSSMPKIGANEYLELPATIFEMDNLFYTEANGGLYDEESINSSKIILDYNKPIIIKEEIMDLTAGISRRLTLHTDITIKTQFDINDFMELDRETKQYIWASFDVTGIDYIDLYPWNMETQMSNDELISIETMPIVNGILSFDFLYNSSKYNMVSSETTIIKENLLELGPSELSVSGAIYPRKENLSPTLPITDLNFYNSVVENTEQPITLIKTEENQYQNEFISFEANNIIDADAISHSIDLDMMPEYSSINDVYQRTLQEGDIIASHNIADPSLPDAMARAIELTYQYSIPTNLESANYDGINNIVKEASIINFGRTITLETVIYIKIIDFNDYSVNIVSDEIDEPVYIVSDEIDEPVYIDSEGDIVDEVFTNIDGDIVDESGEPVILVPKDNTLSYAFIFLIGIAVIGITYAFIKKFKR